jgi:hypothetical protein
MSPTGVDDHQTGRRTGADSAHNAANPDVDLLDAAPQAAFHVFQPAGARIAVSGFQADIHTGIIHGDTRARIFLHEADAGIRTDILANPAASCRHRII